MIDSTLNKIIDAISLSIMHESSKAKLKREIQFYLSNTFEKLRVTKNLLFRNEPIDFFENYLPLTLQGKNESIRLTKPLEIIRNFNKVAILGNAGSGKSTLLRYITLDSIKRGELIPIYIELRLFGSQNLDFDDFVVNTVTPYSEEELKELFKEGNFLFLFDGFDEINFVEGENAISQIQNFISKYNRNSFVISSRPGTNVESLNEFHVYELAPLSENDIFFYVEKLNLSNNKKDIFYKSIENDNYFHQYLTTPLFLSIYIDYIINHNELTIPKNKTIFFRNIIDTLFSKHDAVSKLGFVRTKLSGLNKDELENVATILAFRALLTSKNTFSKDILIKELELIKRNQYLTFENDKLIYDLTITVNILIVYGDYYTFTHILILEYLAALFIARLPQDQKIIFYKKVLLEDKILISSSLLNFLYELDFQMLLKEFVITKLDKLTYSYNNKPSDNIVKEFLKMHFQSTENNFSNRSLIEQLKRQYKIDNDSDLGELFSI